MANLARVRCEWSGSPLVGAGLSTFYFEESGSGFPAALVTFFQAIAGRLAQGVAVNVPNDGDLIDDATGALVGAWSESGGALVGMSGLNSYVLGVGGRVRWLTDGIVNGHRVRGSTFLVPADAGQIQGSGALAQPFIDDVYGAANALVANSNNELRVWTRPTATAPGGSSVVTGADVPDKISWLRSRRT